MSRQSRQVSLRYTKKKWTLLERMAEERAMRLGDLISELVEVGLFSLKREVQDPNGLLSGTDPSGDGNYRVSFEGKRD